MPGLQALVLSVTSLVSFLPVLSVLVWAAIQDGRYDAAQRGSAR